MTRDPLARLPTEARLGLACALCVLPLGLVWSRNQGSLLGSQTPVRVFLVFGALALAYAAARRRTPLTRRLVRAATVAIVVAAMLAFAGRAVSGSLCLIGALALVAPLVWPVWPQRPVAAAAQRGG